MTNLEADVSSSSFSTAVLLVGLELEPEEGERKAMNEFFLMMMMMTMMMINTLMGLLSVIFSLGTRRPEKEGWRRGCVRPRRYNKISKDIVKYYII